MAVKLYDPASYIVVFGTHEISGYAEGTKVRVERDERSFTKKTGVDGETTRTRNRNKGGSITIMLMQTSASNLVLSAALAADELSSNGVSIVPAIVKDNAGFSVHTAKDAWVQGFPASESGKEVGEREWVIDTGTMVNVEGGN